MQPPAGSLVLVVQPGYASEPPGYLTVFPEFFDPDTADPRGLE